MNLSCSTCSAHLRRYKTTLSYVYRPVVWNVTWLGCRCRQNSVRLHGGTAGQGHLWVPTSAKPDPPNGHRNLGRGEGSSQANQQNRTIPPTL